MPDQKISERDAATLDGTETVGVIQVGIDKRTTVQDIANMAVAQGAKRYCAVLSQTDTADPVATVIHNDFADPIVWTRSGAGLYLGTLAGEFTAGKTFVASMHQAFPFINRHAFMYDSNNTNTIGLLVMQITDNATADWDYSNALAVDIYVFPNV